MAQLSTDDSPSFVNGVLGTIVDTKLSTSLNAGADQATPAEVEIA